jgi:hypothetical protein
MKKPMKSKSWIVIALLALINIWPVAAQTDTINPESWIPADVAGFVRLSLDQNDLDLRLSQAITAAALLQPERINPEQFTSLDAFVPLDALDVQGASFTNDILPWLNNDVVIAYGSFDEGLTAAPDAVLMIFPTIDPFTSASAMNRILEGQDFLERVPYRDFVIYQGDKTSIAITPSVVLIGGQDLIKASLDLQNGEGQRLIDQPTYSELRVPHGENPFISGYIRGDEALNALSLVINGETSAAPLLTALGDTLRVMQEDVSFETALLSSDVEGVIFSLSAMRRPSELAARVTFVAPELSERIVTSEFDAAVLNFIPQNAVVVQSGPSVVDAAYDFLSALPLASFSGGVIGGFPVEIGSVFENPNLSQPPTPTTEDLQMSIEGFFGALESAGELDLREDVLAHLSGSYSIAVLPRPNNPAPVLNTPFDLLIVSQVTDGEAALDGMTRLIQTVFDIEALTTETIGDFSFRALKLTTGESVLQFGIVDNALVIATGSALQPALDARRGDNRLISREQWQIIGAEAAPYLYLDINAFYNTFFPAAGGQQPLPERQIAIRTQHLGEGLFEMQMLAVIEG